MKRLKARLAMAEGRPGAATPRSPIEIVVENDIVYAKSSDLKIPLFRAEDARRKKAGEKCVFCFKPACKGVRGKDPARYCDKMFDGFCKLGISGSGNPANLDKFMKEHKGRRTVIEDKDRPSSA